MTINRGFSHDIITFKNMKIYHIKEKTATMLDYSEMVVLMVILVNAETLRMLLLHVKLSLSVRPVLFLSISHILPCIKLYSKMAVQVLVYGCVQF